MCDQLTIFGPIKVGDFRRKSEWLACEIDVQGVCHDCQSVNKVEVAVTVPCYVARNGNDAARSYVARRLRHDILSAFGPISYQKFVEAVSDKVAQTDMKALAGEVFLLDMPIRGRA